MRWVGWPTGSIADGLDVLRFFDGRISAELRVWDAIDQQYLVPFAYYGIHDGLDLRDVPFKRGAGYDVAALTNVYTGNDVWVSQVIEQIRRRVGDPAAMRALGFCVSVDHARLISPPHPASGTPTSTSAPESGPMAIDDRTAGPAAGKPVEGPELPLWGPAGATEHVVRSSMGERA